MTVARDAGLRAGFGYAELPQDTRQYDASIPDAWQPPEPDTGVPVVDSSLPCPAQSTVDPETSTGSPSWKLAELAVYVAPIGDLNDNAAEMIVSTNTIFGPKHVYDTSLTLLKSAQAHDPPYDKELADGLVKAAFTSSGCFKLADLNAPSGIIVTLNLVPSSTAPSGPSFEQPGGGPVIAFSTLAVDGDLFINGSLIDPNFDSTFPKAALVYGYPEQTPAGFAHLVLNFGENQPFSPTPLTAGAYVFTVKLGDGQGNGTTDTIHFVVQ